MKTHNMFATVLIVVVCLIFAGCGGTNTPDPNSEEVIDLALGSISQMLGTEDSEHHTYTQIGPILETSIDEDIRSVTFETKIRELDQRPAILSTDRQVEELDPSFKGLTTGETKYYVECMAQRSRTGELVVQVKILNSQTFLDMYPKFELLF